MKRRNAAGMVLLLLCSANIAHAVGREGGNGGDVECDAKIKSIVSNIQSWISGQGPDVGHLDLSSSLNPATKKPYTTSEYDSAMLTLLAMPLDSSCSKDPVQVDDSTKVCKTSVESGTIHMVCDRDLLLKMDPNLQIQQIHHEFATSVAGLEPDSGPISSYKISTQLSAFTSTKVETVLVVMAPPSAEPAAPRGTSCDLNEAQYLQLQHKFGQIFYDAAKPVLQKKGIQLAENPQILTRSLRENSDSAGEIDVFFRTADGTLLSLKVSSHHEDNTTNTYIIAENRDNEGNLLGCELRLPDRSGGSFFDHLFGTTDPYGDNIGSVYNGRVAVTDEDIPLSGQSVMKFGPNPALINGFNPAYETMGPRVNMSDEDIKAMMQQSIDAANLRNADKGGSPVVSYELKDEKTIIPGITTCDSSNDCDDGEDRTDVTSYVYSTLANGLVCFSPYYGSSVVDDPDSYCLQSR